MSDAATVRQEGRWTVGGMSCAGCVSRLQRAVACLPGVADVHVSLMAESLHLTWDPTRTDRHAVEAAVRRLGFSIAPGGGVPVSTVTDIRQAGPAPRRRWPRSPQGRLALAAGSLLGTAWAMALLGPPGLVAWTFMLACLVGVVPVARRALASARIGEPFTIEMLMTMAAVGALVIGAAEEAALVIFLFAVGEWLESLAAERARSRIRALADLVPRTALLVEADGAARAVPADALAIGQVARVRPGDRIPADGVVTQGESAVDESPVTGESMPKPKAPGDAVFAGSINADGVLHLRVTRAAVDNTIARIIRLVEEAESARAATARFIDRFSRVYMPVVVGFAALVAIVPPLVFGADWLIWVYRALALLLVGCPCALVISVPAAIAAALSTGARHGILMKGGAVIESMAKADLVAFDKTGTLTRGRPVVTDVVPLTGSETALLALAAGLEAGSSHPLALAVGEAASAAGVAPRPLAAIRAVPGRGVTGMIDGGSVSIGAPRFAADAGVLSPETKAHCDAMAADGKTVAIVFRADAALGVIGLSDQVRPEAAGAVRQLRALGLDVVMLTGDNARTAVAVADGLGMDHRADLLPDDKLEYIRHATATRTVMMVGDGINDAPALALAPVGVAMGTGTDVVLETADAALLRNRVTDVAGAVRLARAAMANVRQNIAIALGLKAVFLVTSVAGITGLWLAILADTGATVLVTLNALRLLTFDPGRRGG